MKAAIAILFITIFAASSIFVNTANAEKRVNPDIQPYLFFLERNSGDGLIIYEQWTRKSPDEPSMLTVMRSVGGKAEVINFKANLEDLKEDWCRFRILDHKNNDPTVTKAKELLGIKSNFFVIRFRLIPGQIPRLLLSVKDSPDSAEPKKKPEIEPNKKANKSQ